MRFPYGADNVDAWVLSCCLFCQPWNTQNCTLGWSVQGIWPAQADGCDVNSVDINFTAAYGDKVVAAGDNYGRLRLFKYPVQSSYAISRTHHVVAGKEVGER